jgi:hypothetical protein
MEAKAITENIQRHCEHCLHFQEDKWNTGYCQLHNMYVLKTFGCLEFVSRRTFAEGGGAADDKVDDDGSK